MPKPSRMHPVNKEWNQLDQDKSWITLTGFTPSPKKNNRSLLKSFPVICIGLICGSVVLTSYILGVNGSRITHYLVDDSSISALENQNLREEHCQLSSQKYKPGDSIIKVDFSSQPEVIFQQKIKNSLSLNRCDLPEPISGESPGTSLLLVLEYVHTLVVSSRLSGDTKPVVITLTIHEAEPGPNQPNMDEFGFQRLNEIIQSLKQNNAVIAIAGPSGYLQRKLEDSFQGQKNLEICTTVDLSRCVDWAFESGRNLDDIQFSLQVNQ